MTKIEKNFAKELGKKGGTTTLKRRGQDHFRRMAEKRWNNQPLPQNTSDEFDFKGIFTLDMSNNHQGSVAHGKHIINEIGKVIQKHGVRGAIKFQYRHYDTFIHPDYVNDTTNKHVKRFLSTRLTDDEFGELAEEARKQGLLTMSTPFDERSVELIEKFDLDILKIASCSATDWPLLSRAVLARKPIIVSTGGLTLADIDKLVSFFDHRYADFALMHCVSIYPTPQEKLELNQIKILHNRYPHVTIGFSTHEEPDNYEAIQIAHAKGARIFERHVGIPTKTIVLNAYSSTPQHIDKWIGSYKRAVDGHGSDTRLPADKDEKRDLRLLMRGVFAKQNIQKGEEITKDHVFFAIPIQEGQMTSGEFKEGMIADKNYKKHARFSAQLAAHTQLSQKEIIYETVHQVKAMLNEAHIPVTEGGDFDVELSHHYGIENFRDIGVVIIDCINREYCKKILLQLPGQKHPYHQHRKKEEAFQVLSGILEVELEGKKRKTLHPGDVGVVRRGVWHRFWTDTGVIFEEVSTTHFNDDSFYKDPHINKMAREERKTKLVNWGRHQFD